MANSTHHKTDNDTQTWGVLGSYGEFYPVVCHIDIVWNVHGGNRKEVMRDNDELKAEEQRFLKDWKCYVGASNANRLEKIAEIASMEFFGVDFTIDENEELFIYELNASMRHSFDHAKAFPYKLPYDLEVSQAFSDMIARRLPPGVFRATPVKNLVR